MQDIILVGSGGCMREIVWQMQEQNKSAENWNILGYVDRMPPEEHSSVTVGNETIKYIFEYQIQVFHFLLLMFRHL
mgnify:CR=1 FL=1